MIILNGGCDCNKKDRVAKLIAEELKKIEKVEIIVSTNEDPQRETDDEVG